MDRYAVTEPVALVAAICAALSVPAPRRVQVEDTRAQGRWGSYDFMHRVITVDPTAPAREVAHELAHHISAIENHAAEIETPHGRGWYRAWQRTLKVVDRMEA